MDPDRLANVTAVTHGYVDSGRFPNAVTAVLHRGKEVLRDVYGWADIADGRPIEEDSIFRIFSMTKPIVSLALMQRYEKGEFLLEDPIGRYIPELADLGVWAGEGEAPVAAEGPVTVKQLLTHTAGFTAGFQFTQPVAALYRDAGVGDLRPSKHDLATTMGILGGLPLVCQPGSAFHYGMSTDVVGRLVEVLSGQGLDEYLAEHVLGPLGMDDTGFWVPEGDIDRFISNYLKTPDDKRYRVDTPDVEPPLPPADLPVGGRRSRVDPGRLPALLPDAARRRRAGRATGPRAQDPGLHGDQPPARRPDAQRAGSGHLQRGGHGGHGLRPRGVGAARPRAGRGHRVCGRVRLGRRRQHGLLGGSRPRTSPWSSSPNSCRPAPTPSAASSEPRSTAPSPDRAGHGGTPWRKRRTSRSKVAGASRLTTWPTPGITASSDPGMARSISWATASGARLSSSP